MATEIQAATRPRPLLGDPPTLADLATRWTMATMAPWRPGDWSKLGLRLQSVIEDLVQTVAMVDHNDIQEYEYGSLTDELVGMVRVQLIRRMHARGLARSGYEDVGSVPEQVR